MAKRSAHRSTRRQWRWRSRLVSTGHRVRTGLLILIGLSLLLVMQCLDRIGPPPAIRLDALWVQQHIHLVRVMIAALAVALTATVALIFSTRGRAIAVVLWVLAGIAAIWLFDDRLWIIARVVVQHA